jgi:hypothetical protein
MSLSSVTREQHPFTDDLTPQIVVGSHHDFLKFATLSSLIKAEDLITAAGRHSASRHRIRAPVRGQLKTVAAWNAGSPNPICSKFNREKETGRTPDTVVTVRYAAPSYKSSVPPLQSQEEARAAAGAPAFLGGHSPVQRKGLVTRAKFRCGASHLGNVEQRRLSQSPFRAYRGLSAALLPQPAPGRILNLCST